MSAVSGASADSERPTSFLWVASGYLVEQRRVLLVLHRGFRRWVPPGGHVEAHETFAEAAEREFHEETGIRVRAISAGPTIHPPDDNATPEPLPFYVDRELEGFRRPAIVQYFYVAPVDGADAPRPELAEVEECRWFAEDEVASIPTFEQVRSVACWALAHHPTGAG
jgi:8-oxo-dGTP diphosphatase